jgi:fructan beta-fructosidase
MGDSMKIAALVFAVLLPWSAAGADDVVIADFEGIDWAGWKAEGQAFDVRPASGRYEAWNQPQVKGFLGKGFANSFFNNQYSSGTLTSPEFRVERDFVNFLIGGIKHPEALCVALVVKGRDQRRATASQSETLEWASFDVKDLKGETAHLEIRDRHFNGWINVDEIRQSDEPKASDPIRSVPAWEAAAFETTIDRAYLLLPVHPDAPLQEIRLEVDGKALLAFYMQVAQQEAADYVPVYDLSAHRGRKLTVRFEAFADSCTPQLIRLSDAVPARPPGGERPEFHPYCRIGKLNDPNGLVYYDGEYHLFHQYALLDMRGKHWAHLVSTDLVHWRELPIALYPDHLGSMHSGSAVVDAENTAGFQTGGEKVIVAAFTGSKGLGGSKKIQVQGIAYSNDRGRTFIKYEGNPVIGSERGEVMQTDNNRDPKVFWHEPTGRWVMALFERKGLSIFTSPDLKEWTFESHEEGFHECPEMFELAVDGDPNNTRWVMYGASGSYALGTFDGKKFTRSVAENIRFHYGNRFYASQTFNNIPADDGRRILVAWTATQLSFPVELTLRSTGDGLRVFANPIREIASLYLKSHEIPPGELGSERNPLDEIVGELFDIQAEFRFGTAGEVGLAVRGIPIRYDVEKRELECAGRKAPLDPVEGCIRLRLVVDRTSIEIFANDGRIYMPMFLDLAGNAKTLSAFAKGGVAHMQSLTVHELKSAWE